MQLDTIVTRYILHCFNDDSHLLSWGSFLDVFSTFFSFIIVVDSPFLYRTLPVHPMSGERTIYILWWMCLLCSGLRCCLQMLSLHLRMLDWIMTRYIFFLFVQGLAFAFNFQNPLFSMFFCSLYCLYSLEYKLPFCSLKDWFDIIWSLKDWWYGLSPLKKLTSI